MKGSDVNCPECGAPIPTNTGVCRANFDALLVLEASVPGAPGEIPHFFAVGCYALQHPESMNYTAEALAGLRVNIADVVYGRASLEEIRRRTRRAANGSARVTRRAGDAVVRWPVAAWPMNVADVLAGGVDGYAEHVAAWARSIVETLAKNDA